MAALGSPQRACACQRIPRLSAHAAHPVSTLPTKACALCSEPGSDSFRVGLKRYWACPRCQLIALDPSYYLSAEAEYQEYLKHDNDPDSAAYRRFLQPALRAFMRACPSPAAVLDYGCGPGPALARMLREAGYDTTMYDPLFAHHPQALDKRYRGITCTEVAEHWQQPGPELQRLWSMLSPGGVLLIQTQMVISRARFAHWQYRNDPTHVHFFAQHSFVIWAQSHQAELHFPAPAIALLRKAPHESAEE